MTGNDEMAELARLQQHGRKPERKQRKLDTLRRNLIAWAGHDLRTPLASVRAIVEALADGVVEDDATRTRYLQTAQRDIGALALLIDDLFEMAQIDAGGLTLDIQANAMTDLISDTLESFSGLAAEKEIALTWLRSRAWIRCSAMRGRSAVC
ncbi:MAG: histidine kinase dimerization/phospho-acceptor domain-containing protein [Caldilineaceae bacterium]